MHDRIREHKPELLESTWNGFHLHRFGEQPVGEPPYTPIRIPVFSERDGVLTVILIGGYAWMAADEFDAPFSDRDREALATFERPAADPEFRVSFQLERGEAALFNNCAVLHNRTAFEDHDESHLKRHLMRLWLMDWDGRRRSTGCDTTRVRGGLRRSGTRSRTMRIGIRRLMRRSEGGALWSLLWRSAILIRATSSESSALPLLRRLEDGVVGSLVWHVDFRFVGRLAAIHRQTGGFLNKSEQGPLS